MRFVQNEQTSRAKIAQPIAQTDQVVFISEQIVTDEKMAMSGPRIHAESPFASPRIDVRLVEDGEAETKSLSKLVAPLQNDGRGRCNDDALHALAQQQFLQYEASFDGLAKAHVIGDEEVHAGQGESFAERFELVALGHDSGAQGGLKEGGIGGCHATPAQRVQVGSKGAWVVGRGIGANRGFSGGNDASIHFGFPDDIQALALGVVIYASERNDGGFVRRVEDVLHKERALTYSNEGTGA